MCDSASQLPPVTHLSLTRHSRVTALQAVYCIKVTVTLKAATAKVTENAKKFPLTSIEGDSKTCINTKTGGAPTPGANTPATTLPTTPTTKPTGNTTAASPAGTGKAVKYYCIKQYNVGGTVLSNKTVAASPTAATDCAQLCNDAGSACASFGLSGTSCYLVGKVNTAVSKVDAAVDAYCMKNLADWLAFGAAGEQSCVVGWQGRRHRHRHRHGSHHGLAGAGGGGLYAPT